MTKSYSADQALNWVCRPTEIWSHDRNCISLGWQSPLSAPIYGSEISSVGAQSQFSRRSAVKGNNPVMIRYDHNPPISQ